MTDSLLFFRNKIDSIDKKILSLLSKRAECAGKIGYIKQKQTKAVPFYRPEREKEVL